MSDESRTPTPIPTPLVKAMEAVTTMREACELWKQTYADLQEALKLTQQRVSEAESQAARVREETIELCINATCRHCRGGMFHDGVAHIDTNRNLHIPCDAQPLRALKGRP